MTTRFTTKKVLMIDDNEDFAFSMSSALSAFGHELAVAYSGKSGIEKFKAFCPDVVICDIGLPDMLGYEVARWILAQSTSASDRVFLIALSGYGQESVKKQAFEAGFDIHLTKPVSLEDLLNYLCEA